MGHHGVLPRHLGGALGEGRWHAIFAIAGMLAGAAIYAELYPFFQSTVLAWKDFGKIASLCVNEGETPTP